MSARQVPEECYHQLVRELYKGMETGLMFDGDGDPAGIDLDQSVLGVIEVLKNYNMLIVIEGN
jgi:hypothetical protein